ncbi:MAG: hypothetical protein ACD_12C00270G0001 [uncultured bacterium]|nr:MAG: hypothetical protein ACD_12C00270G0001 [uncultured bacterium]
MSGITKSTPNSFSLGKPIPQSTITMSLSLSSLYDSYTYMFLVTPTIPPKGIK